MAEHYNDNWRHRAACIDADPELFFPIGETSPVDLHQIREARSVCMRCDVRLACLAEAYRDGLWGIWGGTTERERGKDRHRHKAVSA